MFSTRRRVGPATCDLGEHASKIADRIFNFSVHFAYLPAAVHPRANFCAMLQVGRDGAPVLFLIMRLLQQSIYTHAIPSQTSDFRVARDSATLAPRITQR